MPAVPINNREQKAESRKQKAERNKPTQGGKEQNI